MNVVGVIVLHDEIVLVACARLYWEMSGTVHETLICALYRSIDEVCGNRL
jgi:hypothetical protein